MAKGLRIGIGDNREYQLQPERKWNIFFKPSGGGRLFSEAGYLLGLNTKEALTAADELETAARVLKTEIQKYEQTIEQAC